MLLLEQYDTVISKVDFDDLVYLIELAKDSEHRKLYISKAKILFPYQLEDEFACNFVLKVTTLGKRAYPAENDEQVVNEFIFLCLVKGLRDPQQVMQIPD